MVNSLSCRMSAQADEKGDVGGRAMETVMSGIEKDAGFYRGYLTDDRSIGPLAAVLVTLAAIGLLFYLIGLIGPAPTQDPIAAAQAVHGGMRSSASDRPTPPVARLSDAISFQYGRAR